MSNFRFGTRSETNLKGVHPRLVEVARLALAQYTTVDFTVIEGLRTRERQRDLVNTGKSQTMNSMHIAQADGYGHAIDIFPVGGTWKIEEFMPVLRAFKKAADQLGVNLRFGRNWSRDPDTAYSGKFVDAPHIEIPVNQ